MVGIGSSSDPYDTDEESTIQQIISQAQDSIILQQISAINCSSFTHSDLPTDLESRFLKLKSFPANHTTPPPYVAKAPTFSNPPKKSFNFSPPKDNNSTKKSDSDSGYVSFPSDSSIGKKGLNPKSESPKLKNGSFSSPSYSSHTSEESSISSMFMPLKMQKDEGNCSKKKAVSPSPSPPRKWGCFWCSPKKEKKKGKENDDDVVGWEECTRSDELLSGIGSLSSKKRLNMIEKALKEEEKRINREAEKIIELVKHASGRMNVSDIDDELSDD
ncbi:uncharacterized protein LOC123907559 [Trifolium pratense]|uniref:uncharacterized protein LOC123907559 n=1 Tax=Trifolium pratense TaxID=57577 RepID=UPI001E690698|nr:uncharacterized protein LOC123907559 [Trifolium pratense]